MNARPVDSVGDGKTRFVKAAWRGVDRWLIYIVVFSIVTSAIGMAAALTGAFHAAPIVLASLLVTCAIAYATRDRTRVLPGSAPRWRHVLLLVIVALLFRLPAYHYVMGGQDEGLYVNIAHHIQRTGSVNVNNNVRESLQNTPYLGRYDLQNHTGDSYMAGVYKDYGAHSALQFQFYDLFPVWMALFIGVFGTTFGVYALTLFALLSIVLFYRLALLLTDSHHVALVAGGLLALSPLHAFFSKFPVTEVPTLYFSVAGFLFVAAYCSDGRDRRSVAWLAISIAAFFCVFLTRISGFMYVPFLIGLAWIALLLDPDRERRANLQVWAVAVTVAYAISVVYGLTRATHYSHDIYSGAFAPLLGAHWETAVVALCAVGLCCWLATGLAIRRPAGLSEPIRRNLWRALQWLPLLIVCAALLLGLLKIYWLGWTDHYSDVSSYIRWRLPDSGWFGASATSLWLATVFMGPLLVLAFFVAMGFSCRDARVQFLRWFMAGFFVYVAVLQWVLPYSPYYARYLLSEFVPYTILVVVCIWGGMRRGKLRALFSGVLVISLAYGCVLTSAQIGKSENAGAYTSLARIARNVGPSDVILIDRSSGSQVSWSEVGTSLRYTFGRAVAAVGKRDLGDPAYIAKLGTRFDETFLLTSLPNPPGRGFAYVTSSRFKVMQFQHDHSFPYKLVVGRDYRLYLYRRVPQLAPVGDAVSFAEGGAGLVWLRGGWSHPEAWGTWSLGSHATLSINPETLPKSENGEVLRLHANVFVNARHPIQRVNVAVDGAGVGSYVARYPSSELTMNVTLSATRLQARRPITVSFALPDAISPAAAGQSSDPRVLAIGLTRADIVPEAHRETPPSQQ